MLLTSFNSFHSVSQSYQVEPCNLFILNILPLLGPLVSVQGLCYLSC